MNERVRLEKRTGGVNDKGMDEMKRNFVNIT
jgi:hypothetical protein